MQTTMTAHDVDGRDALADAREDLAAAYADALDAYAAARFAPGGTQPAEAAYAARRSHGPPMASW